MKITTQQAYNSKWTRSFDKDGKNIWHKVLMFEVRRYSQDVLILRMLTHEEYLKDEQIEMARLY